MTTLAVLHRHISRPVLTCLLLCVIANCSSIVNAQITATVTVNPAAVLGTIPSTGIGINAASWDSYLLDPTVPACLIQLGARAIRYPGGESSDAYDWQTDEFLGGYIGPNNFDQFMTVANAVGASPIITANYGSNPAGTAGGDPNLAAAWVQYSNVTKGYGVKYWEIGNEVYGNGEYYYQWEEDLHASHTPTTYGQNVAIFSAAMKAMDPTIKVGAVLALPGYWPDGNAPDWNSNALANCGTSIDFVIVHWYPQSPGSESDSALLASSAGGIGGGPNIASMMASLKSLINKYCGANAPNVQILVTETNSVSSNPGKQAMSVVNSMFMADNYMYWLENGAASVDVWALHNGYASGNTSSNLYGSFTYGDYGILSDAYVAEPLAETPFPTYYGIQMAHALGAPGDSMVSAASTNSLVSAHAVKQTNGNVSVLLMNEDPANAGKVTVNVTGYTPAPTALQYFYGGTSASIAASIVSLTSGSFSITLPSYSLTTVELTPSGSTAPTTGSVMVTDIGPKSATVTWTTPGNASSVVNYGATPSYGSSATGAGGMVSHLVSLTGLTPGTIYHFSVTSAAGTQTSSSADSVFATLPAGDFTEYNFETGAQGWTSSGAPIGSVAASSDETFLGNQSLALSFNGTSAGRSETFVTSPTTPPGATVSFHVWIPSGSQIDWIQPFIEDGNWEWTANWQPIGNLTTNAWNTITLTVPPNAATPLNEIGVQFDTTAAWTGTCYVDSISWPTLTSSVNPSTQGESVTFTATVYGKSPLGTVQFAIDGANAGSPVTLAYGLATYTTSGLSAGSHTITAAYSGDYINAASSLAIAQTVNPAPPRPVISSLSPSSVPAYSAFTLTVNGTGFASGAQVRLGSSTMLTTTYVSTSQLTAAVPLSVNWYRSKYPNVYLIAVVNPDGTVSNKVDLTITAPLPVPVISSLNPVSAPAYSAFTLTVNGSGFVSGSQVRLGSALLTTAFGSPTSISAAVPLTANWYRSSYPNVYPVVVVNPDGTVSNTVVLNVTEPKPVISSVSPASVVAGTSFTITVKGTSFLSGATINWNGNALATTFASSSGLTATVASTQNSAQLLTTDHQTPPPITYPATIPVTVTNPAGTISNTVNVTVTKPSPVISTISPSSVPAYSAFTLTVNGVNFTSGAQVRIGSTLLPATFVSSNQLTAAVPISVNWRRSSYPNSYAVAVVNADGTVSNSTVLTITAPN